MGAGLQRAFAAARATRQTPMRVLFCKNDSELDTTTTAPHRPDDVLESAKGQ